MSGAPHRIPLPAALVQQVGDYLAARPYREVAQLLAALQEAVEAAAPTPPSAAPCPAAVANAAEVS